MDENHFVEIVDKSDKVIGRATKEEKFRKELISRIVVAFIMNEKGELIVVKRSPQKKSWPNRIDLATCGNVEEGETYLQAIRREVKEEIGVECPLRFVKRIYVEVTEKGRQNKYFTGIYTGKTDKAPILCDELVDLEYIKINELSKKMADSPELFSPSFIREFELVKDLL